MRTSFPPRSPFVRGVLVALACAALLWAAGGAALAAPEAPWEKAIRDGVADQDRELARTSAKALVNRLSGRVSRDPNDVVVLYLLARAYGKAGATEDAVATYGDVLKLEPRCYFAWRDRGLLRYQQKEKDSKGAEADLRQALAIKPDFVTALQDLAALLSEAKRHEEAAGMLSRVLDADPTNELARYKLAETYLTLRKPEDGLRTLQPMLARAPREPAFRLLRARLWAAEGKAAEALAELEALAVENPESAQPLQAWLEVAQKAKVTAEKAIWVLERLARLAREEKVRAEIKAQIERLRAQAQAPPPEAGPPTPERLAALLRAPDAKTRGGVLAWLLYPGKGAPAPQISGPALVALVERLFKKDKPEAGEPDAGNRALAVAVIERSGNAVLAPVLRLVLYDEVPDVRARAADALGQLGHPESLAALYPAALGDDPTLAVDARAAVATAARAAIYRLAAVAEPVSEETPAARATAFRAWWASPEARAPKLRAIEGALEAAEAAPWGVLYPLVSDADVAVWTSAYHAFQKVAAAGKGTSPRERWLQALPAHDATTLRAEGREAFVASMAAWWARRPQ